MLNLINKAIDVLSRFNAAVLVVGRYVIITLVGIIAVVMMAQVVFRYGLDNSIPWSEEVSKYLMVWLAFMGAPIALMHANHISIDLLLKAFPARGQQLFHLLVNIIIIMTMCIVFYHGAKFSQMGARQVASSINISMLYMYIAVPVGSLLTAIVALEHGLRALIGIGDPDKGLKVDELHPDEVRE